MLVRGLLAVAVGIMALAWPGVTVLALVVLFAVYAFIASGLQVMRAFSSRDTGPVVGHLLVGLVDLAAGVLALAWPGPTALVLVLIVASWSVIGGGLEIAAAFQVGEPAGPRDLDADAGHRAAPRRQGPALTGDAGHDAHRAGPVRRAPRKVRTSAATRAGHPARVVCRDPPPRRPAGRHAGPQRRDAVHEQHRPQRRRLRSGLRGQPPRPLPAGPAPVPRGSRRRADRADHQRHHDPAILRSAPRRAHVRGWAHAPGSPSSAYAASKLSDLLTTEGSGALPETAERRITTIAYNPGLTGGTGLSLAFPGPLRQAMRALRPVFILLSRLRRELYLNKPEHADDTLAQLADGTRGPARRPRLRRPAPPGRPRSRCACGSSRSPVHRAARTLVSPPVL